MSATVLVAYATEYGSTKEVAEALAETLRTSGLIVTVEPIREIKSLKSFDGVIIGAPLYMSHWHKDARHFLTQQKDTLAKKPVAVFALGPVGTGDAKEWEDARANLENELSTFPWFVPISVKMFGGKLEPAELRFPARIFLREFAPVDLRDWDAIRAWATDMASSFSHS